MFKERGVQGTRVQNFFLAGFSCDSYAIYCYFVMMNDFKKCLVRLRDQAWNGNEVFLSLKERFICLHFHFHENGQIKIQIQHLSLLWEFI